MILCEGQGHSNWYQNVEYTDPYNHTKFQRSLSSNAPMPVNVAVAVVFGFLLVDQLVGWSGFFLLFFLPFFFWRGRGRSGGGGGGAGAGWYVILVLSFFLSFFSTKTR